MSQKSPRGTKEQQEAIRQKAFQLFKKSWKNKDIAEALSVSYVSVSKWRKLYKNSGDKAFKSQNRGVKPGSTSLLNTEQEKEILNLIIDKDPEQLKLPFALWNREAVRRLIKQRLGIELAIRTTGTYLKKWGLTPQKPIKRAYERNDQKVKEWLTDQYPAIKAQAKDEGAEIHWGDETGCVSLPVNLKGYSPKGQTPVLKHSAKKFKINMISTVTNQGKVRFMIYDEKMTAQVFIRFLKRLIKDAKKKVFLILDNLRVHHSKLVKAWVEKNKEKIKLFYLPSYSPDLNPDEYLNCDLKTNANSKFIPKNKQDLKKNTLGFMRSIQKQPERVKKYFLHKSINYAA